MNPYVTAHLLLCAALFFTVFCRAVKTDSTIKADVRFAFFVLGLVACMGMAAPLAWAYEPDLMDLALLGAVVFVQAVTAHHWKDEVPPQFVKTQFRTTHGRRATDREAAHG
jgi:uncharacterized membrane protein